MKRRGRFRYHLERIREPSVYLMIRGNLTDENGIRTDGHVSYRHSEYRMSIGMESGRQMSRHIRLSYEVADLTGTPRSMYERHAFQHNER